MGACKIRLALFEFELLIFQQLYTILQSDINSTVSGFDTEIEAEAFTKYIPTVVGPSSKCLEPNRDCISRDHLYHKNVGSPTANSEMNVKNLLQVDPDMVHEHPIPPEQAVVPEAQCMFNSYDIHNSIDANSEGNKSPYSDYSSDYSPTSGDGLSLDWNDSFVDLFPQLS